MDVVAPLGAFWATFLPSLHNILDHVLQKEGKIPFRSTLLHREQMVDTVSSLPKHSLQVPFSVQSDFADSSIQKPGVFQFSVRQQNIKWSS
jgi:hypothetical protein